MGAVIVCESMFGCTTKVAEAIAEGLADRAEVSVVPVTSDDAHILDGADLVVVGGPTHTHGTSRPGTRKMAGKLARKPGVEVELVPGAVSGPGVREWLASPGRLEVADAAFDTRLQGPPAFTGRASKSIRRLLAHHGARIAASPESFLAGGPDRGPGRGRTGVGPRLGTAPECSDCLPGVVEAPPGLLTPFAVTSATVREHRGSVSGPGDCSRRSSGPTPSACGPRMSPRCQRWQGC